MLSEKATTFSRMSGPQVKTDKKFMPIPPGAIIPGSLPDFKIYVPTSGGRYILWALEGGKVSPDQLTKLADSGVRQVFVDLEEEVKYEEYLEDHLGDILENESPSDEQKAEIFSKVSTNVVRDAFESSFGVGSMNASAIERTQAMIRNALIFIAETKSVQPLAKMIGHDYQTYTHATKVLWFTVAFLKENPDIVKSIAPEYATYNESEKLEVLKQCGVGALLHDIGKAFVAPDILNKDGPLTPVEWEIIKRHPMNSVAMLLDTEIPSFVKKAVLQHHEDFNGEGYPMGLHGVNISVLARVLRIIDVFDAMTSRRPYKDAISPLKAAQIMTGTPPEGNGAAPDRDQGMRRCFDDELLRKFIVFLGNVKLNG